MLVGVYGAVHFSNYARRQGVNGMQSDLYIRGGSFDQTLLLVDGIKVQDPKTVF